METKEEKKKGAARKPDPETGAAPKRGRRRKAAEAPVEPVVALETDAENVSLNLETADNLSEPPATPSECRLPEDGESVAKALDQASDAGVPEEELAKPVGFLSRLFSKSSMKSDEPRVSIVCLLKRKPDLTKIFSANWMAPVAAVLFIMMFATMGSYVFRQKESAEHLLRYGPEKAYALASAGHKDQARRLWVQINAKAPWYMSFSGLGTNIDKPFLQRAAIAYQAQNWEDVAENAYKALNVPITDQQAVYVQQMILTATANMVKAYLPNQAEQPMKGGIPDHAAPVCDPGSNIWIVPCVLVLVAAICLYGRMRIVFGLVAMCMPLYFWAVSIHNEAAIKACEYRLTFNPAHIELYPDTAKASSTKAFQEITPAKAQAGELDQNTFLQVPIPEKNAGALSLTPGD